MITLIFASLFFLSLMVRGYLFGRYHEVLVDGLRAGYIPTFCGVVCAAVAYNLGAGWWLLPFAPSTAFIVGECFGAAIKYGRSHSGRHVVLVPIERPVSKGRS